MSWPANWATLISLWKPWEGKEAEGSSSLCSFAFGWPGKWQYRPLDYLYFHFLPIGFCGSTRIEGSLQTLTFKPKDLSVYHTQKKWLSQRIGNTQYLTESARGSITGRSCENSELWILGPMPAVWTNLLNFCLSFLIWKMREINNNYYNFDVKIRWIKSLQSTSIYTCHIVGIHLRSDTASFQ